VEQVAGSLPLQCPGAIVNFTTKDNALCRTLPTLSRGRLGCTRIQLGVQHTDDQILKLNNRGHGVDKSIAAIQCARDAGFKVDGHLMPDLPGAWLSPGDCFC
jgi:histone acetyltransferase (RNA polymerase elongator complex component)